MNSPLAIQISIKARMEVEEAHEFYNSKVNGLGERFVNTVYDSFVKISLNPLSNTTKRKKIKQFIVKEFSYVIIYKVQDYSIYVLSVFHTKRNPRKKLSS